MNCNKVLIIGNTIEAVYEGKSIVYIHIIYYYKTIYTCKFFKLSLRMLSQIITAELINSNQIHICETFLRVSSIVLSWDFASRSVLSKTRRHLNERINTSVSFTPPPSWSEFFENSDIVDLFMQV